MKQICQIILLLLLPATLSGCFTGVESTKKITDKDVKRAIQQSETRLSVSSLSPYADSIPAWARGKTFHVTDNQARRLFYRQDRLPIDTLNLEGDTLTFAGYNEAQGIDGKPQVTLYFVTSDGTQLNYDTRKPLESLNGNYQVPFVVDLDMVRHIARQIEGKEVYVKTPIWYDVETEQMIDGQKFIPVKVERVAPGNKVFPLRVEFLTANGRKAMVWMSDATHQIMNRDFDALFSLTDVRLGYKQISDAVWQLIIEGKVSEGMTKEECTLSKGAPLRIDRLPDQGGLREYWRYNSGEYLYFEDGVLKQYR